MVLGPPLFNRSLFSDFSNINGFFLQGHIILFRTAGMVSLATVLMATIIVFIRFRLCLAYMSRAHHLRGVGFRWGEEVS